LVFILMSSKSISGSSFKTLYNLPRSL
jgi:hypothetical protein